LVRRQKWSQPKSPQTLAGVVLRDVAWTAGVKAPLACHVVSHSKTTGLKVESTRGAIDAIPVSAIG
jgi:hypothetical protein